MSTLLRCESCGSYVRLVGRCPSCGGAGGAAPGTVGRLLGLAVMSTGLAACTSMYGIAVTKPVLDTADSGDTGLRDRDGDGFTDDVDCNDQDPEVFPGAADTPGDGLDTNCDGFDDT